MDPLDVLLKSSKETGLDVEIKRQGPNGCMAPVRQNELEALHTKSKIASTAQLLKNLNSKEKLEWAIETKNEGNQLFNASNYKAALEKYVEALTATDFSNDGNVHELCIPVLCNLCLCSIKLEEWHKCVLFADQALKLDPLCEKALFRKGVGLVKCGDYDGAICVLKSINAELLASNTDSTEDIKTDEKTLKIGEKERKSIPHWLKMAFEGRKRDRESLARQKQNLQKIFGGAAQAPITNVTTNKEKEELTPMSLVELLKFLWECIMLVLNRVLGYLSGKLRKTD